MWFRIPPITTVVAMVSNNILKNYRKIFFFQTFFLIKNIKYVLLNVLTSIISFNYINYNTILNYKNLTLIYNLENQNSFYNINTKWLQLFNVEKQINYPVKRFI